MAQTGRLVVRLHDARGDCDALAATTARMLGSTASLTVFDAGAGRLPWLAPLAARMRGVRPPRYPTLWEAAVNGVIFQQISILAAGAIIGRLVERFGRRVRLGEHELFEFPEPHRVVAAPVAELRAVGLSIVKIETLARIAAEIVGGLDERVLEPLPTAELMERLRRIKGIGPWTAAIVALRGFGRLDLFPTGDSGVKHGLRAIAGEIAFELEPALEALGDQRAMLYYHALLGRLEARGEIRSTATPPGL